MNSQQNPPIYQIIPYQYTGWGERREIENKSSARQGYRGQIEAATFLINKFILTKAPLF